jgi:hypothetical protein
MFHIQMTKVACVILYNYVRFTLLQTSFEIVHASKH